ncbi:MAG: tRNA 2-selenouridine(34) synthase MnmH [Bacteroidetes bacterium HGW-Bacteroidetes-22]|nr:MAG: tRNA 2-selenouridine(34) synthase MnmH [Bacteroidetes bacterium HGW-Bacteroidetes-22]
MPNEPLPVITFLKASANNPLVDVRAPQEFLRGHIPGAINIPIFSDEQRARVGTEYARKGQQAAILLGLDLIGPELTLRCRQLMKHAPAGSIVSLYCWRGGLRSAAMEWLFNLIGYSTNRLQGGYKAFRHEVQGSFGLAYNLRVIAGPTGSGKTEILRHMSVLGAQVLDLEALANHRGSVFGGLGMEPQPGTEHFENLLYYRLSTFNRDQVIWVEDESLSIGNCFIPREFYNQMQQVRTYVTGASRTERVERLVGMYGSIDIILLKEALVKIGKRLGGDKLKIALEALAVGDLHEVARLSLDYYDKTYAGGLSARNPESVVYITPSAQDTAAIARHLLAL